MVIGGGLGDLAPTPGFEAPGSPPIRRGWNRCSRVVLEGEALGGRRVGYGYWTRGCRRRGMRSLPKGSGRAVRAPFSLLTRGRVSA